MPYSQREENDLIAAQIDAARARQRPLPARRLYVDPEGGTLKGRHPRTEDKIRAMAGLMAHHVAGGGACTEDQLRCAGFSPAEIAAYRDRAAALARTMGGHA